MKKKEKGQPVGHHEGKGKKRATKRLTKDNSPGPCDTARVKR